MSGGRKEPKEPYDVERRPHDVLPSLMDILRQAVERASDGDSAKRRALEASLAEFLPPRRQRGHSASTDEPGPASQRTISDYLRGKRWPNFTDVEHIVAAVALETGEDRINLWRLAIDAVEDRLQTEADERMQAVRSEAKFRAARRREAP